MGGLFVFMIPYAILLRPVVLVHEFTYGSTGDVPALWWNCDHFFSVSGSPSRNPHLIGILTRLCRDL